MATNAIFEYYNGNCGDRREFGTIEEALIAAETEWMHMTASEREACINSGFFHVCDAEGIGIRDYTETVGWDLAERFAIGKTWIFDDCAVYAQPLDHDLDEFIVLMERRGFVVRQDMAPGSIEEMRAIRSQLSRGESPVGCGWEDGSGDQITPDNGKPTVDTIDQILERGEITGGISDPDGDIVQVKVHGELVQIFLDRSFGDAIPDWDDILQFAQRVGTGTCSYYDAVEIRRD